MNAHSIRTQAQRRVCFLAIMSVTFDLPGIKAEIDEALIELLEMRSRARPNEREARDDYPWANGYITYHQD